MSEIEESDKDDKDEEGNLIVLQAKPRPFIDAPIVTPLDDIQEPEHPTGYVWNILMLQRTPTIFPAAAEKNGFTSVVV